MANPNRFGGPRHEGRTDAEHGRVCEPHYFIDTDQGAQRVTENNMTSLEQSEYIFAWRFVSRGWN